MRLGERRVHLMNITDCRPSPCERRQSRSESAGRCASSSPSSIAIHSDVTPIAPDTPAQEASAIFRRKAIYEELHPETKHGGNSGGPSGQFVHTAKADFASATADATGKDERTIRRANAYRQSLTNQIKSHSRRDAMNRAELLMAALAAGGENATFTPVQVQKLFFLIDREASHLVNGPHFNFTAYDYGPFDRAVYDELEELAKRDLARVESTGRYRVYGLSQRGFREGTRALGDLPEKASTYISNVSAWVRKLSFEQLVASIYNRYPEMKANSVFRG